MTTQPLIPIHPRAEPARARAVFSTEDFGLLREAVAAHLRAVAEQPESVKFSNLYHRLGRLS
jgi:hypothetical protein